LTRLLEYHDEVFALDPDVEPLTPGLIFSEPHPGKRWNCEHDTRDAPVIRLSGVALDEIGGDNVALVGRQRELPRHGSGVPRSVHSRVGDALEILSDQDASVSAGCDIRPSQLERLRVGHPSRSMHHQVGFHHAGAIVRLQ
jgi:hypothetical protein